MKPSHWTALAIYLTDLHAGADDAFFWPCVCFFIAAVTTVYSVLKRHEPQAARQEPPQR